MLFAWHNFQGLCAGQKISCRIDYRPPVVCSLCLFYICQSITMTINQMQCCKRPQPKQFLAFLWFVNRCPLDRFFFLFLFNMQLPRQQHDSTLWRDNPERQNFQCGFFFRSLGMQSTFSQTQKPQQHSFCILKLEIQLEAARQRCDRERHRQVQWLRLPLLPSSLSASHTMTTAFILGYFACCVRTLAIVRLKLAVCDRAWKRG